MATGVASVTEGRRAGPDPPLGVAAGQFGVYLIAATVGITAVFTLGPALDHAVEPARCRRPAGGLRWNVVRPGRASAFAPRRLP